jgi:hypothetical protein
VILVLTSFLKDGDTPSPGERCESARILPYRTVTRVAVNVPVIVASTVASSNS